MADSPFANLGLGMLGSDVGYAKKAMSGSSSNDGNEFLAGLLSFMGVGKDTQDKFKDTVKDFKTNPFAAVGPKITQDMYGVSPNAMGPAMPPQNASPVPPVQQGVVPVASMQPAPNIFDQQIEQQRQQTQDILGKLIPRNLPNTPQ